MLNSNQASSHEYTQVDQIKCFCCMRLYQLQCNTYLRPEKEEPAPENVR